MALLIQRPADVMDRRRIDQRGISFEDLLDGVDSSEEWRDYARQNAASSEDTVARKRSSVLIDLPSDDSEAQFRGSFRDYIRICIFRTCSYALASRIPEEIIERIEYFALQTRSGSKSPPRGFWPTVANPKVPPAWGGSPFLELPIEIRAMIYKEVVQLNTTIAKPCCESNSLPKDRKDVTEQKRTARQLCNLMVLNSKICKELQHIIYEGRRFAIHVHSGYIGGGVEFVDTGRQPLQFHVGKFDDRFKRFALNDDFGFSSLAQIDIHIFPVRSRERKDRMHGVLAANAMNAALVNLIRQRIMDGGKVNSLRLIIETPEAQAEDGENSLTDEATDPWWNGQTQSPLWTCFYNLSDIKLALQPFARLHNIHDVRITLPRTLASHEPTRAFCQNLTTRMKSVMQSPFEDHELAAKIECAHLAMESRWDRSNEVPLLTEEDFSADDGDEDAFEDSGRET
jgi:hypothetical protein